MDAIMGTRHLPRMADDINPTETSICKTSNNIICPDQMVHLVQRIGRLHPHPEVQMVEKERETEIRIRITRQVENAIGHEHEMEGPQVDSFECARSVVNL